MFELYVGRFDMQLIPIAIFAGIVFIELLCVFIVNKLSHAKIQYVSQVLPTDGYYWSKGWHKNNIHKKKRPFYIGTLSIYIILLAICILCLPVLYLYITSDYLQYYYLYFLVVGTVVGHVIKAAKSMSKAGRHLERLKLLDICRVINDPLNNIMVFIDRHGWIYETETSDPTAWTIGDYFDTECIGETVNIINTTPTEKKFFGYQVLKSRKIWTTWISFIFIIITGVILCFLDIISGVIVLLLSLLFMPLSRQRTLCAVSVRQSVEYKDISPMCKYIFACIDEHSNVYYYETDDALAMQQNKCYLTHTRGSSVLDVLQSTESTKVYKYSNRQSISTIIIVCLILFITMVVMHICGWEYVAYVLEAMLCLLQENAFKYDKRSDI